MIDTFYHRTTYIMIAQPYCATIYIAAEHIFSPASSNCYPSILYFSQQVHKYSLGKNGCSIESASQEETLFLGDRACML